MGRKGKAEVPGPQSMDLTYTWISRIQFTVKVLGHCELTPTQAATVWDNVLNSLTDTVTSEYKCPSPASSCYLHRRIALSGHCNSFNLHWTPRRPQLRPFHAGDRA